MSSKAQKLDIVFAASESLPYAKTGGLADVIASLSASLVQKGLSVTVFLPLYGQIDREAFSLISTGKEIVVPVSDRKERGLLYRGEHAGVMFYFIEQDRYFNRLGYYGTEEGDYFDNAERFLFFSRGILEGLKVLGLSPDVLHCHDWHTALIPLYLKESYRNDFPKTATLFTIHNLGYQGVFWHYDWHLLNLPWDYFYADGLEFFGKINFLKGGLFFADQLTTVSRKYAKEIQTPAGGQRLEGVLRKRQKDLVGIVNGIDTTEWDSAHDPYIAAAYDSDRLAGKAICKTALQKEVGLPCQKERPLLAMITRLVAHKGIDLLASVLETMMKMPIQCVILGNGEKHYEDMLAVCAARYPEKMVVKIGYDPALAHRIEAGADLFLMPSQYEPCGLTQLVSLRYGTIPIVHATGGLEDTVASFKSKSGRGNGFKFKSYTARAFIRQIQKSLSLFRDKKKWRTLMRNGMRGDYSWGASAEVYVELYQGLIDKQEKR